MTMPPQNEKQPSVGVICVYCGQGIFVNKDDGIDQEFSIKCPNCERRAFYKRENLVLMKAPS